MKFKAIGGSWDGLMIGFEGERTERYFRVKKELTPKQRAGSLPLEFLPEIEEYTLRSTLEVRPGLDAQERLVNEPVGEVIFYIHSTMWNLSDTEIIQLLIDQHRPADKKEG